MLSTYIFPKGNQRSVISPCSFIGASLAPQYFFLIYSSLLGRVVTGDVLQAEPDHYLVLLSFVLHRPLIEVQKYKGALVFLALTQYGYHCLDGFDINRYLILIVSCTTSFWKASKEVFLCSPACGVSHVL